MTTKELMAIINTRLAYDNGNPTSRSFLLHVSEAMKRLQAYVMSTLTLSYDH